VQDHVRARTVKKPSAEHTGSKDSSGRRQRPVSKVKLAAKTSADVAAPEDPVWSEVQGFFTVGLNVLYRLLDRQAKSILGKTYGLSPAEWRTLAFLAAHRKSTVREIAARRYIAKSQISRAADILEEHGLIKRSSDPANARSVILEITPAGRKAYLNIFPVMRERNQRLQAQMTAEERRVMDTVIARLTAYVMKEP
jgi:DNA-binding MarR family transcriptional regulator